MKYLKEPGPTILDSDKSTISVVSKNFHLTCDMYDANNEIRGWVSS